MNNIKHYSIRRNYKKSILKKTCIFTTISVLWVFFINFFWLNRLNTDILWTISMNQLLEKSEKISFNGTTWPVKKITDIGYISVKNSNMTYSDIRAKEWNQIPDSMKTTFPTEFSSYINKYKNITLEKAWNIFSDPEELNEFIFRRRILRATWTSNYSSADIWKKNTWTHAWIDIVSNTWTPIYSIANWLVVKKEKSNKWFGNYISILHNIDGEYYLSFYGHMHTLEKNLKIWDFVQKWDKIWTIWNSWNSFGSHLHLQINKVFALQDIVNGKVMMWWYHNLDGVKAYTVDPISFIEKHYTSVWDNLASNQDENNNENVKEQLENNEKESTTKKTVKKIQEDDIDLVAAISKELETKTNKQLEEKKHVSAPEKKAYIKDIDFKLINNKIQLWHSFEAVLSVSTGSGIIWIIPSNENLKFAKDKIENPSKEKYTIQFTAKSLWDTKITFNDWETSQSYDIRIYEKETEKIYWIRVETNNLNLIEDTKINIYPINKFWQVIDAKLEWNFKIYTNINNNKELIKNIYINDLKYTWYIRWNMYWKWKLIVESDKFYSKINITVDISKDYPYNGDYAYSMFKLIKAWVINWENGKLYPDRKLTRRELLTIIWRSVLDANYDNLKLNMQKHIKENGRFFNDIDGSAYSDPYVYLAWEKGIIKWENGYSFANNYVSKWEILTIFTRLFNIKVEDDNLNTWSDLQANTQLKKIADTSKKYGLYPFKNYISFSAWSIVSRIVAFETLQRFLNYTQEDDSHISLNTEEKKLEEELNKIFEF